MENLPALDELLRLLDGPSRARWKRHVEGAGITWNEQSSQEVLLALRDRQVDEALYAVVLALRESGSGTAVEGAAADSIVMRNKRDMATADAIGTLTARQATMNPPANIPQFSQMREWITGRADPLTKQEAWDLLNRAEELPRSVSWERLHTLARSSSLGSAHTGPNASLSFRDDSGRDHQFRVGTNAVLGTLWLYANSLFMLYNWPTSQAAWFLLTDEPPTLLPAIAHIERGALGGFSGVVTVTALAYGGEESIKAAMAMARRQLFGRRRGALVLERHAMAAFVDAECGRDGEHLGWAELLRRWNKFAPTQWRLFNGKRRYPTPERMLDAYRREVDARRNAMAPEEPAGRSKPRATNAKGNNKAVARARTPAAPSSPSPKRFGRR